MIVNFICNQIVAHFCNAKTGHLRCCLYTFYSFFSLQFEPVDGCDLLCDGKKKGPNTGALAEDSVNDYPEVDQDSLDVHFQS